MLLVLTGITVVCVALLAYVNELTKEPIEKAKKDALALALKKVIPGYTDQEMKIDTVAGYVIYAPQGDANVGVAVESGALGFGGELKILVGFDAEGNIYNYSLLAHSETPGLGAKADVWFGAFDPTKGEAPVLHEVSAKSILGLNPGAGKLEVSKDGGQVDAITASTITSRAFLKAVNNAYETYMESRGAAPAVQEEPAADDSQDVQPADSPSAEEAAEPVGDK